MQVTNPEVVRFLWSLVMYTDEVDEKGTPRPRSTYPRAHYRNSLSLAKKMKSATELGFPKEGAIEWEPLLNCARQERPVAERLRAEGIEIDSGELGTLKAYFAERTELPVISEESFTEIEGLLK